MIYTNLVNKRLVVTWLILLLLLLVISSCSIPGYPRSAIPTPTLVLGTPYTSLPGVRQFPDTWNNIHLFQSFDYEIDSPTPIAKYYDFIWGADPTKVAAFRFGNPNIFLSFYISFFRDTGTFADNAAIHTLAYWQKVHPDWILYQCDRRTPAYEDGLSNVPFKFTNPAVIAWQIQTYALPASQHGYDAIAADNVNLKNSIGACGYYDNGKWVQRYSGKPDDPQWRADIGYWASAMQQALHHLSHPLALIPNLGMNGVPLNDPELQQVVNHVDGVLDEGGFTNYGNGYLTGNNWVQDINFIESIQQQHKAYYIVNEFLSIDQSKIQWALASYLMCKGHSADVAITPVQGYGTDLRYHEYTASIGSPLGSMYQDQQVYWRKYTHGLSLVNPSPNNTFTVTLPAGGSYVDLYGNSVAQTVTLPPQSGLVLLVH